MAVINITLNTFLICYIGEVLTERCKEIGNMVYMTNWYRLPKKDILNLIMIITRSSVEYKMTAGKIIDMSVITFGNVRLFLSIFKKIFLKKYMIDRQNISKIFMRIYFYFQIIKTVFGYLNILRQVTML